MSMTLSALRSAVQGNLGFDARDSDFDRWINEGLLEIAKRHDFSCMLSSTTVTTVDGTATYTFSSKGLTNFKNLKTFRIKSGTGYIVRELTNEEFDAAVPYPENDAEGTPRFFIKRSDTQFLLYPTPDAAYTCVVRWSRWPLSSTGTAYLSATSDTHPYPAYMDKLVVCAATIEAYDSFEEPLDASEWKIKFEKLLREAVIQDKRAPTNFPTIGKFEDAKALPTEYWLRPDVW